VIPAWSALCIDTSTQSFHDHPGYIPGGPKNDAQKKNAKDKKNSSKKHGNSAIRPLFIYVVLVFVFALTDPYLMLGICGACGLGWGHFNKTFSLAMD
jgi:hypothetical protein